jgi:hypothetical protein
MQTGNILKKTIWWAYGQPSNLGKDNQWRGPDSSPEMLKYRSEALPI